MRFAPFLFALTLSTGCAFAAPLHIAAVSDGASLDTPFTVKNQVQVPGKVLKPGGYTITIKDHLSDRAIIQISGDNGKVESTFLGVFHSGLQGPGSTGPIVMYTTSGPEAYRGFTFPGGGIVEFVYPKAEAAAIATKSSGQVLAIDPASDNLKVSEKNLSREDAQVVTLWSLEATRVSAGQNGIAAKKYVAPVASGSDTQVASNQNSSAPAAPPRPDVSNAQASVSVPAPRAASAKSLPTKRPAPMLATQSASDANLKPLPKRPAPAASTQSASAARRPAISALPHTGSQMPLLLMVALGGLTTAAGIRIRRSTSHVA